MAKRLKQIAAALGAAPVITIPITGGGAFGAARLGRIIAELRENLVPGQGKRPGRPTQPE